MGNDRLYTEKEISEILKRAGKVQAKQSEKVTVGLSLEEIQQLAEEVGLEPDIIANVAQEIDIEPEDEAAGFFSSLLMPTKLDIEQVITGSISEEDWPEIMAMIEKAVGKSGSSSQVGKLLEWTSDGRHSKHKFSLIRGDNQTKLLHHSNFNQLALSWTLPILINVGVWAFILFMINFGMIGIPLGLAVIFSTYLIILSGFKNFVKKKRNSVKAAFLKMRGLFKSEGRVSEKTKISNTESRIQIPDNEFADNEDLNSVRKKVK